MKQNPLSDSSKTTHAHHVFNLLQPFLLLEAEVDVPLRHFWQYQFPLGILRSGGWTHSKWYPESHCSQTIMGPLARHILHTPTGSSLLLHTINNVHSRTAAISYKLQQILFVGSFQSTISSQSMSINSLKPAFRLAD